MYINVEGPVDSYSYFESRLRLLYMIQQLATKVKFFSE